MEERIDYDDYLKRVREVARGGDLMVSTALANYNRLGRSIEAVDRRLLEEALISWQGRWMELRRERLFKRRERTVKTLFRVVPPN